MRDIFLISDTHFGHANILNFMDKNGNKFRGDLFSSLEEMNEKMIENWNNTVRDNDIIYHLGDVYFGQGHSVLSRLRGRKRLILGNHDNAKDKNLSMFEKILVTRMFPDYKMIFSHYPLHPSGLEHKVSVNVHGHIHEKVVYDEAGSIDQRYVNVGVERINYTPISIEDIKNYTNLL